MSCSTAVGRDPPVRVSGRNLTIAGQSVTIKGVAWMEPMDDVSYSPHTGDRPSYRSVDCHRVPATWSCTLTVPTTVSASITDKRVKTPTTY